MSKIKVTCIKNPFQPRLPENKDEREFEYKNQTISQVFCEFYPIPSQDIQIVASVNGKIFENAKWDFQLEPEDHLVFVPVPKGGGGGGSNVMAIVAMVVVAAIAWYAAPMLASATMAMVAPYATVGGTLLTGIYSAAIMIGGGLLISSIFPTKTPSLSSGGELSQTSETYSWGSQVNSTQEGTTLPVIIGERRVTPPLIGGHSVVINGDSYLYLLYAVSEGQVDQIYGVEINDQPVSYYSNAEVQVRYGSDSQTIIPFFNDTYADASVNSLLNKETYVTRETSGDGVDATEVHISLPMGLWYANDKGGMDEQTLTLSIQYKKSETSIWNTYYPESDDVENYISGKIYTPGQLVRLDNTIYQCTHYYVHIISRTPFFDEGWITKEYDGYTTSLKNDYRTSKTALPTPQPPNASCWAVYTPPTTSLLIRSNSNSAINKSYRINFPSRGKYDLRCKVVSGPPTDNSRYGGKAVWSGFTEIIKDDFTYPGVALLGVKIKATDQLSGGLPKITCIARKNTVTLPDAGTIDLTNPAWASYYTLNNQIWGGGIPESNILLSHFQLWASFCNEKGLKCCFYLDQRITYNDLKNYLCEIGRGNVVQYGTKFGAIIDKPDVPTQLFTIGNIVKDSFKMNYLPIDDRANVVRVNYYDKDQNWEKATVEVRTDEFISGNKEREQEITLYACDIKDLAVRHAKLLLNYNANLIRTCTFDVSIDAIACAVGDIIKVQHDATRYGHGGRILAINGTSITLDQKIMLSSGVTYSILARRDVDDVIEQKIFTVPTAGEYAVITISTPFSANVTPMCIYSLGELNIEAKPFRIVSISRKEDFLRSITAIEYYEEVYNDAIVADIQRIYMAAPIVSGLNAEEIIDNVFSLFSIARLTWLCPGSRGCNIEVSYTSGSELIVKKINNIKTNYYVVNEIPIGIPITFKVYPCNNSEGFEQIVKTFWAEENAIYDSGCYEFDVFANNEVQNKAGFRQPYSLWLQEPQVVNISFLNP